MTNKFRLQDVLAYPLAGPTLGNEIVRNPIPILTGTSGLQRPDRNEAAYVDYVGVDIGLKRIVLGLFSDVIPTLSWRVTGRLYRWNERNEWVQRRLIIYM
jgi:hypothetical protein